MINLDELEQELRKMKPRQKMYEVVRKVLREQGRWKNAPRGTSVKVGNAKWQHLE